jgi:hypothetical protein
MNNKFTGEPAGYGFINFETDQKAIYVMHRLGGKVIPNSNPPVRFKLNHNSTRLQPGEIDTSIWVGDLTPEVDDFALYQYFTQRYQTVRCAKVVLDENGYSKGYGFVRFGVEGEQQHALSHMTGELGLGSKPIKVSMANQKNRSSSGGPGSIGNGSGGRGGGAPIGWGQVLSEHGGGASTRDHGGNSWATIQSGGVWPGGPGSAGAVSGSSIGPPGTVAAAQAPHDLSAYHQYYQQYAQFSQQQQQFAAWSQWQQHQQQQQQ